MKQGNTSISIKTVERLIRCRRELLKYKYVDKPHVFSSDLARILNIKPEQLRQDIMSTGIASGNSRKGYDVNRLILAIEDKIKFKEFSKVAFVGDAKLLNMFEGLIESTFVKFNIAAIFSFIKESDFYNEIPCYSLDKMLNVIKKDNIEIAIIAVSADMAFDIADSLQLCGIKGIINLTSENLNRISGVVVENHDLISVVEKINFILKI